MDKVFIEALEIETLIGIHAWERQARQPLRFDIEMGFDNRVPAASDAIADTLDYEAVVAALREHVGASRCALLEQLAEECAQLLAERFGVRSLALAIAKPKAASLLGCARVGIRIQRYAE